MEESLETSEGSQPLLIDTTNNSSNKFYTPLSKPFASGSITSQANTQVPEISKAPENQDQQEAGRQIPFIKFFSYLTFTDQLLLGIGTFAAVAAGAILPSISLVMGNVAAAFSGNESSSSDSILQTMTVIAAIVSLIALTLFVCAYTFYAFWQHLAANITLDLRKRYIAALMHQEIAYFEVNKVEQIPAQIAEIFETVQSSIGEKISNLIFAISACLSGIVYALVYGWAYALACVAYLPFLIIILVVFGMKVKQSTLDKLNVVKQLGGIAEETLTAIKVVTSFGREQRELEKFTEWSQKTREVAKKQSETFALMVGLMKFTIFFFYSYSLYIGSWFIQNTVPNNSTAAQPGDVYDFKAVLQTIIALITGFVCLISALPNVQAIVAAKTLGVLIFDVIERVPNVRNGPNPLQKYTLNKGINFNNVTFKYPTSLPEHKPVLIDASFTIQAGKSTAIVGPSGSGKSTIVQLIERFYDPRVGGSVDFDGQDIKNLDLKTLRESIGYVSQEPVMIMGTIRDNLLFGNKDASEQDCVDALKQANAAFVQDQENGLDTFVGTAGIMNMSGGQKQRIAIARALIKKPKILILDEATSALDPKSEIEVQTAIEKISNSGSGLTILIIAHRLTTIASADNLLFFKSRSELVTAAKGTTEYDEIFEKLKSISYANGAEEPEENQNSDSDEQNDDFDQRGNTILEDIDGENDDEPLNNSLQHRQSKNTSEEDNTAQQIGGLSLNASNEDAILTTKSLRKTGSFRIQEQSNSVETRNNLKTSLLENQNYNFPNSQPQNNGIQQQQRTLSNRLPPTTKNFRTASNNMGKRTQSMKSDASYTVSELLETDAFQAQKEETEYRDVQFKEIMEYYKPTSLAIAGFICSVFASLSLPLFGFVLSKYIFVLSSYNTAAYYSDPSKIQQQRDDWTLIFAALCFGIGSSSFLQKLYFGRGGENLTYTLRVKLFEAYLSKHIGWFDNKNRAPGILTNTLTEDISSVNGLTTESLGIAVEAALGLFFSCLICFIFSPILGIVVTLTSPFMVLGGLGMSKLQFNQKAVNDSYKQANALLNDLIMNYRTVISFGEKNVQFMLLRYNSLLIVPHASNIKAAHISGLFFGYSQCIRFIFIGFVFFVAAIVVTRYTANNPQLSDEEIQNHTQRVFTGCYVVFVGAIGSGVSISQMPSISKAKSAAKTVFGIIEESSQIDPKQQGVKPQLQGCIEFRNLYFRYPSRQRYVLRKLNLTIEPNQSVAIVGHSGSGKSTIASLLLRFYDVSKGGVYIDGINIKEYDLEKLRNQISIVQQEPMLFNETIKSNIQFGEPNSTDARVLEVAIQANALGFIMQNDEDYNAPTVIQKVTETFNSLTENFRYRAHPKILSLLTLAKQNQIDFKHLMFLNMMLPFLREEGLQFVENNLSDLIVTLKWQVIKSDCTWQKVLKALDFQSESRKIEKFVYGKEQAASILTDEMKKEIQLCLQMNECQFDLQTVKNFCQTVASKNSQNQKHFSEFLKTDRGRVELYYQERFNSFIDQEILIALENKLDPGFQKICGLKGSKLSGGQKQRIAIARALIKAPKIMILDEATSALDEQSQEIVQQALDRAMEGRTSVVIAHRMTTIKKCNRIVVLHKGCVVEDGTYEELTQIKDGHFKRLEAGIA